jgi:hypothetical protein
MQEHAKDYFGGLERLGMVYVGMLPVYKDEDLERGSESV